jgi:hypothetical protein
MFKAVEPEAILADYDLVHIGDDNNVIIGGVARVQDGYVTALLQLGDLRIEGDLDQKDIAEALDDDEIGEHTLVVVDGDLDVEGKIDICDDNTYTHLVVLGNLTAKTLICNASMYVKGNVEVGTFQGERVKLLVGGTFVAKELLED